MVEYRLILKIGRSALRTRFHIEKVRPKTLWTQMYTLFKRFYCSISQFQQNVIELHEIIIQIMHYIVALCNI